MLNLPQIGFHGVKPLGLSLLQVSEDADDALGITAYEHTFKVSGWFYLPCRSLRIIPCADVRYYSQLPSNALSTI